MKYLVTVAALSIISCTHADASRPDCTVVLQDQAIIDDVAVLVFNDRHGDYARIVACDINLAINYSQSGLFTPEYAPLLLQMRRNANFQGGPIRMVIDGRYEKSSGVDGRATIFVTRIVSYQI